MVHLIMKFNGPRPVFTGLAFATDVMATALVDHRNKAQGDYHFLLSVPVDIADVGGYDGKESLEEGIQAVHLVVSQEDHEEVIVAAYTDQAGANLLAEGKNSLVGNSTYTTRHVPVLRSLPSGDIDENNVFALV